VGQDVFQGACPFQAGEDRTRRKDVHAPEV
jgi:hypothetical protein